MPVGGDGARGTHRDAQLALDAGVDVERLAVGVEVGGHQDRAQGDGTAELRVDDAAVPPHAAHPSRLGHRLVGHRPHLARPASRLEGEAGRHVHRPHPELAQTRHDGPTRAVRVARGLLELHVDRRMEGGTEVVAVEPEHQADDGRGVGKHFQDVGLLVGRRRILERDETDVVGAGGQAQLAQLGGSESRAGHRSRSTPSEPGFPPSRNQTTSGCCSRVMVAPPLIRRNGRRADTHQAVSGLQQRARALLAEKGQCLRLRRVPRRLGPLQQRPSGVGHAHQMGRGRPHRALSSPTPDAAYARCSG